MEFKGSRTEANLMAAFAGESQARIKYYIAAQQARNEGYQQIGDIFEQTAANEYAHAYLWFLALHDKVVPPTLDLLLDAAGGEHFEWSEMYRKFAEEARTEGFTQQATSFALVADIEHEHEERYRKLIANLQNGATFQSDGQQMWICRFCGHIHTGATPPQKCPVCSYPQAYFERRVQNY